ncbi:MAG: glycoside hydrolase family 15 protein [Gammaproteobacteria bacterium]
MPQLFHDLPAFGQPGIEPRWTRSDKQAVGTARSASARIWFTVAGGIVSEVYFPTIDHPQTRDLQFLITDGETFFHDERRHTESRIEPMSPHALGFRLTNRERNGRYALVKEILADPHYPCLLMQTRLQATEPLRSRLQLYALLAPHLDVGGWGNNGNVVEVDGRRILTANRNGTWLALAASTPFRKLSCGYVSTSDGWTDLHDNFHMDWEFDSAPNGNIALTGEIDLSEGFEFTLALAFGRSLSHAVSTLLQSLTVPVERHREQFIEQWEETCAGILPLEDACEDGGTLFHMGYSALLAHEDKMYPGAMIASLSIPWGEARSETDLGGYHLVWTRDMVHSATGLLAAGNTDTPRRALVYLIAAQRPDGHFPQNFWIDGTPYWHGLQLDEVAFPILLAWRLQKLDALWNVDPLPMVLRAAGFLIRQGPVTEQERWEENSGLSPSTLASSIAALICAADLVRNRGDEAMAVFLESHADFLESHIEAWTVTTEGTLVPGIPRHYIRITPADPFGAHPNENPNEGMLAIRNRPPGAQVEFPAKEIVDGGFLELVRYGIRPADDPVIRDSIRVIDAVLKVDTPSGPCWYRYNHDGYGQREDGGPYIGWGKGRPWPILTGERGHYELAAGRDVRSFVRAMEGFASAHLLLPEQIWDEPDRADLRFVRGEATGSAMPLMWAHAEYIKLLRSVHDGRVFDRFDPVAERYLNPAAAESTPMEVWKFNRQVAEVSRGTRLRVLAQGPFRLRWTNDEWQSHKDTASSPMRLGIDYVDLAARDEQRTPLSFTFFWPESGRWEGRDFSVRIR